MVAIVKEMKVDTVSLAEARTCRVQDITTVIAITPTSQQVFHTYHTLPTNKDY